MNYLGSKSQLGRQIAEFIATLRTPGQPYLEPFVGACNVAIHLDPNAGPRICSDVDADMVALWQSVQRGWAPPVDVDETQYRHERDARGVVLRLSEHRARRAFIKYGCSWGGKPWGGFGRDERRKRHVPNECARSIARKAPKLEGISFTCCDYSAWGPRGWVIYCDPPYEGTTGYRRPFDHGLFWATVRRWSASNVVLVSEYRAPADFDCVWERPFTRKLDDARIVERVFRCRATAANANQIALASVQQAREAVQ